VNCIAVRSQFTNIAGGSIQSTAATSLMSRRLMIDPCFLDHRRQNGTCETVERVFDKFNFETAEIAGRLDIAIRIITSQTFSE
jgi:hypothetical protein